MQSVQHIIAVASGKGGVGKSTVAVNLALALKACGARVGLLDADIYGPSQPLMLGVAPGTRPDTEGDQVILPVEVHGLKTMSMGYLTTDRTPLVWRGPMAGGALTQMLEQTRWGELDYLLIDMPPGTGDIQLTLAQKARVSGAVIVTTPQDIALLDARKGIEMFRKVDVPILGIIENMALHECTQCGHVEHVFGSGGGADVAAEYGAELLASLPLAMAIREQTDAGRPTVLSAPDSAAGEAFMQAARRLQERLAADDATQGGAPDISVTDD
ncbi:iron-sulfur cluster carrier protein ApbC [Chromatocurvus halotolerans]|uniref:Iron-sulfur cluster carrier protein n=1 Tax=Chromatocurvus halotolerans TaxID=1132028 RepID=A0A4R2KQR4_9GAMM|nr:ATP-binding protein involved in chromosome partitioning [Chromatocurvus halotolerans]